MACEPKLEVSKTCGAWGRGAFVCGGGDARDGAAGGDGKSKQGVGGTQMRAV